MPDTSSQEKLIVVPTDVSGSWTAMLAIYQRWASNSTLFDWKTKEEYRRSKALKSQPMATLLKQLSCLPLRHSFRIGSGLHGIGLLLPCDGQPTKGYANNSDDGTRQTADSRMVTLNVTEDRQIEIRLLDCGDFRLRKPVLKCATCDPQDAPSTVERFVELLHGTKIAADRSSS